MNPLIPAILKLLPNVLPQLIPLADALLGKRGPKEPADHRLYEMETALHALAARSLDLERRMQQMRVMSVVSLLLSLSVLVTVLVR